VSALVAAESTEGAVTVVVVVESPVVLVSSVEAEVEQEAKIAVATKDKSNFFIVFFNF
jgi:hypothetical protein